MFVWHDVSQKIQVNQGHHRLFSPHPSLPQIKPRCCSCMPTCLLSLYFFSFSYYRDWEANSKLKTYRYMYLGKKMSNPKLKELLNTSATIYKKSMWANRKKQFWFIRPSECLSGWGEYWTGQLLVVGGHTTKPRSTPSVPSSFLGTAHAPHHPPQVHFFFFFLNTI